MIQFVRSYGSWIIGPIGVSALFIAGSKHRIGWLLAAFVAEPAWIVYAIIARQYGLILASVAYASVHIRNYVRWRRDSPK